MDGHSKEEGGRALVNEERARARRYSAQQRDRLYPVDFSGFALSFSEDLFTGIVVLHDFRLEIQRR